MACEASYESESGASTCAQGQPPVESPPGNTTAVTPDRRRGQGGIVADQTYTGEFYCVKCKAKREATGNIVVSENGTRMAKGKCPVCGTNLNRILGKN